MTSPFLTVEFLKTKSSLCIFGRAFPFISVKVLMTHVHVFTSHFQVLHVLYSLLVKSDVNIAAVLY